MRKFMEKFGLLMQVVLSFIFVLFVFLLLVGALDKADFHNSVVYILFGTFIALQITFSALLLYFQYSADLVSSVVVSTGTSSNTRASISVIKTIVKGVTKELEGVKTKGIKVTVDDKGLNLHLKVKLFNRRTEQTIDEIRVRIAAAFKQKLNLEFYFINFLLTSIKNDDEQAAAVEGQAQEMQAVEEAEAASAVEESVEKPEVIPYKHDDFEAESVLEREVPIVNEQAIEEKQREAQEAQKDEIDEEEEVLPE